MAKDKSIYIFSLSAINYVYKYDKVDLSVLKDKNDLPSFDNLVDHRSEQ